MDGGWLPIVRVAVLHHSLLWTGMVADCSSSSDASLIAVDGDDCSQYGVHLVSAELCPSHTPFGGRIAPIGALRSR
eukprot:7679423-Prorocentrum_lima.AAC.1